MSGPFETCLQCGHLSYISRSSVGTKDDRCPKCKTVRLKSLDSNFRRSGPTYVLPRATHKLAEIDGGLSGSIFVYLATEDHVSNWVNGGGCVPIKLASDFKGQELQGNKTPDETVIHESPVDLNALRAAGIELSGSHKHVWFANNVGPNGPIENFTIDSMKFHEEDGRVMCFSRTNSRKIADFFGREFCVRIDNIPLLKEIMDEAVGAVSVAGKCQYTDDFQRNVFLKANDQAFMDEFRIYWPNVVEEKSFTMPTGVGVEVPILDSAVS